MDLLENCRQESDANPGAGSQDGGLAFRQRVPLRRLARGRVLKSFYFYIIIFYFILFIFISALTAWSSGIVSACHRGDWSYGS
jgi:hypothetical protein